MGLEDKNGLRFHYPLLFSGHDMYNMHYVLNNGS